MTNIKTVLGSLAVFAATAASAFEYEMIGNATPAGTVLKSGFYQVSGVVKISAADDPGESALRVAPGSEVTINIPFGSTLTVVGGNAEGMVGGGAGIEVPADSKLLICGAGLLYAQGGNAASGATGRVGEDGEMTAFLSVKPEDAPNVDPDKLPDPLVCLMTGAGGDGGNGGGGAGAAIGGRGGRGGLGGAGGVSHPVVAESLWNKKGKDDKPNYEFYESWLNLLGHQREHVYLYDDDKKLGVDGLSGAKGLDGKSGGRCGEIVIGEYVQVIAIPGMAGSAGNGGACGQSFSCPDQDSWTFSPIKMFFDGLEVVMSSFNKNTKDDEDEDDEEAATLEQRRATMWAFGGGGGGGGAGGAGAPQGIGPGGAGGAGGGGAGGGLFAYGANAKNDDDEVQANGGAGLGGEGFVVMTIEGEEGEEDTVITSHGEAGEESDQVNYLDDDGEGQQDFNVFTNVVEAFSSVLKAENLNRLCTTSLHFYDEDSEEYDKPVLYWAGQGAAGGAAGKVLELGTRKFRVSENATVLVGLEEENQESFEGEVIIQLTLGSQTAEVICGPLVTPVPVPEAEEGFFMGYFTETDGRGEQYFDYLGQPVGHHEIWNAMTLYPHFASERPADVHKIEFRHFEDETDETGDLIASIWVREGRNLPMIGTKTLDKIRGWRVTSAYLPGATEEDEDDEWYDEDGLPIKEGKDGEAYEYESTTDTILHVTVEPKWDAMAEMPEENAHYVFTGKGISGVELDTDEYEIIGGTSVATNVGHYVTTICLKDEYEIWDDYLESPATATNPERTVEWQIVRADLDQLTLPNRIYDWAKTNSTFEVAGKIPEGVTVNYTVTKVLGNGTVEIRADVDGGKNYHSKSMIATWTIPELMRIVNVTSHYPWDTTVELDVVVNPTCGASVYSNRLNSVITPVAGEHAYTDRAFTVGDAFRGAGTVIVDLKDALMNGRDRVEVYFAIDGVPCALPVEIAADTTAVIDENGVPTYTVSDPKAIYPINQSWRYAAVAVRTPQANTELTIHEGADVVTETFMPVNPFGLRTNDGTVGWTPQTSGDYELTLTVDCGGDVTTNLTAKFNVAYSESVKLPVVAYVGETGFTTLKAAIDEAKTLSGDARQIRVVGDVQTEDDAVLPDGAAEAIEVAIEHGGVLDPSRQFAAPENAKSVFNQVYALVGYTWEEGAGSVPEVVPTPEPITPVDPGEADPVLCANDSDHTFKAFPQSAGQPNSSFRNNVEVCTECGGIVRLVDNSADCGTIYVWNREEVTYYLYERVDNDYILQVAKPDTEDPKYILYNVDSYSRIFGTRYVRSVAKPGYVLTGPSWMNITRYTGMDDYPTAVPIDYSIVYTPGWGEGTSVTNNLVYEQSHTVRTIGKESGNLDFSLTGYSFAGVWTNLVAETSYEAGSVVSNLTTVANDKLVFEPIWTPNEYTVKYRLAPEIAENEIVTNVVYDTEFEIASNVFSTAGYTFGGWERKDGVEGFYQPGEVVSNLVDKGEVVLSPLWNPVDYTVTYKPGEGRGREVVQANTFDVAKATLTADEVSMSRKHYVLAGWASAEHGTTYGLGESFSNLTNVAGGNADLTAVWRPTEFPITVDKIPEHVSVMVLLGDEQIQKEEAGWYVSANTNATVIFTALDGYLFNGSPISPYATVEVAVGETAPEPVNCPTVLPPAPSVGCTINWKDFSGNRIVADLKISVTNGAASAVDDIVFLFEYRADDSKIVGRYGEQLPIWGYRESWFSEGVKSMWLMLKADYDTLRDIWQYKNGTESLLFSLPALNRSWDSDTRKKFLDSHLCWIGWRAYGRWTYAPVGAAAPAIAEYMPEFLTPVSVADINAIISYVSDNSKLEFTHFKIVDGKIAGVVRLSEDGKEVAISGTTAVKLHGTDDLKKGFEPCGDISLKDGAFTVPIPTGKSFFKLSLETPTVR